MSLVLRRLYTSLSISSLTRASKVVCIGRNYADHIAELQNERPKKPFFFLKPPSAILPPGAGPIIRPRGVDLHYEVELALIIGRRIKDLDAADEEGALDAIEGYAVAIDMTARNVQDEARHKGLPWDIAKGFDTFLPISNIIPKTSISGPHNLLLHLRVNDKVRQQGSTDLMLFRIPRILSEISQVMTLERGDIVITGTPDGVGSVKAGDVLKAGLTARGKDTVDGRIEVAVEDSQGSYEFTET